MRKFDKIYQERMKMYGVVVEQDQQQQQQQTQQVQPGQQQTQQAQQPQQQAQPQVQSQTLAQPQSQAVQGQQNVDLTGTFDKAYNNPQYKGSMDAAYSAFVNKDQNAASKLDQFGQQLYANLTQHPNAPDTTQFLEFMKGKSGQSQPAQQQQQVQQ